MSQQNVEIVRRALTASTAQPTDYLDRDRALRAAGLSL